MRKAIVLGMIIACLMLSSIGFADTGWWNPSWAKCRNLIIYDTRPEGEVTRVNDLVDVNITGLTVDDSSREIRIVNAPCNSGGSEQPYTILDKDDTNKWARVLFLVNRTTGSKTVYSAYYNYTNAPYPNYNFIDYSGDSTTKLLEHFSGSLVGTIEDGTWTYLNNTGWGTSIKNDQGASSRISESDSIIPNPSGGIDFYWKPGLAPDYPAEYSFIDTVGWGSAYDGNFFIDQSNTPELLNNRVSFGVFNSATSSHSYWGWYFLPAPQIDFDTSKWYRITAGYNSTNLMIRVSDGNQVWTDASFKDAIALRGINGKFFIGGLFRAFNGTMDEFRWYDYTFVPLSVEISSEESTPNCGDTITEDTVLYDDLVNCRFLNGLIIGADNITLDCNGHLINGNYTTNSIGIYLNGRTNVTVKNCMMTNFRYGINLDSSPNNTLISNTANSNYYGIFLNYSSNNILTNNIANSNVASGIALWSSSSTNNVLTSNTVNSNAIGIYSYSPYSILNGNIANSNGYGIVLDSYSGNNVLINNIAISNSYAGIELQWSHNNNINNNTVNAYQYGIYLKYSSKNMLTNNTVNSTHFSGIALEFYSENNTLTGNMINSNAYGIGLDSYSSNNSIYNNYLNNMVNAVDSGNNFWNTTKKLGTNIIGGPYIGGNYWSDYKGVDIDGDGLGNTKLPYNSNGNILNGGDYLPLTIVNVVTPPNITILSPQNKTYNIASIPLTFTINETTSWNGYSLDGQPNVTISGNITLTNLSEGSHSITVYANDTYGIMGKSEKVYFKIMFPPVIVITSPINNTTYSKSYINLNFTVNRPTSWIGYSLNNTANKTITGSINLTGLANGWNNIIVYANDTFGNMGFSNPVYFFYCFGDVNGDKKVDIMDLSAISSAFGSYPGQPRWNSNADINGDGRVDIFDLVTIAKQFGKTCS